MREIHNSLVEEQIQDSFKNDYLQSFILNNTSVFSEPYYAGLGFIDGAFFEQGKQNNVTACRINSIRFANNATLLAWNS